MRILRILAVLFLAVAATAQVPVAPLNNPRIQLFSAAGAPLSGGKVYTYAAGSSTPLATYSDAAGTVLNANPVILDSGGFATIFLKTQAYKICAANSASVQQWCVDNLRSLAPLGKPFSANTLANRPTTCTASTEFFVQTDSPYTLFQCNSTGNGWTTMGIANPAGLTTNNTFTGTNIFNGETQFVGPLATTNVIRTFITSSERFRIRADGRFGWDDSTGGNSWIANLYSVGAAGSDTGGLRTVNTYWDFRRLDNKPNQLCWEVNQNNTNTVGALENWCEGWLRWSDGTTADVGLRRTASGTLKVETLDNTATPTGLGTLITGTVIAGTTATITYPVEVVGDLRLQGGTRSFRVNNTAIEATFGLGSGAGAHWSASVPIDAAINGTVGATTPAAVSATRYKAKGTALVAGDFALVTTGGWGDTPAATIGTITGNDQAWEGTVTGGTANFGANPTITLTFKDGTWTDAPMFICKMEGGTGTITDLTETATATQLVVTFLGTPGASTYIIRCIGMGR